MIAALEWTARTKLWTTICFYWFMTVMVTLLMVRLAWSMEYLALGGMVTVTVFSMVFMESLVTFADLDIYTSW